MEDLWKGRDPMEQIQEAFEAFGNGLDPQDLNAELQRDRKRGMLGKTGSETKTRAAPVGSGNGFGHASGNEIPKLGQVDNSDELDPELIEKLANMWGIEVSDNEDNGAGVSALFSDLDKPNPKSPHADAAEATVGKKRKRRTKEEIEEDNRRKAEEKAEKERLKAEEKARKEEEKLRKAEEAKAKPKAPAAKKAAVKEPKPAAAPAHQPRPQAEEDSFLGRTVSAVKSVIPGLGRREPTEQEKKVASAREKAVLLHKVRQYAALVAKYRGDGVDPTTTEVANKCSASSSLSTLQEALEALQWEMNRVDPLPFMQAGLVELAGTVELMDEGIARSLEKKNPDAFQRYRARFDLTGLQQHMHACIESEALSPELEEMAIIYGDKFVMPLHARLAMKCVGVVQEVNAANVAVELAQRRLMRGRSDA